MTEKPDFDGRERIAKIVQGWDDPKAVQDRLIELFSKDPPPEAAERLMTYVDVFTRLGELTPKQLVDVALRHLSEHVTDQNYEQVVEELCTRVYPNWSNEPDDGYASAKTGEPNVHG
jgi:hypothetical protein